MENVSSENKKQYPVFKNFGEYLYYAYANPDASSYDIRLYFQGVTVSNNGKEKMNNDSKDETYTKLIADLRAKMKSLAGQIEPKIYEYDFLKRNFDLI